MVDIDELGSPITEDAESVKEPVDGIALCLSGGGYRAMLFHLGALWRLNELGYLQKLSRISSVSGGSITAAVLGLHWNKLEFHNGVASRFVESVVSPIRSLADRTIDVPAILLGLFWFGTVGTHIARRYSKHLFGQATLADLPPDPPRFVINATNVQSGALWRFSKPYMRDYKVGAVANPKQSLALAVAASSAFPPVLSPVIMNVKTSDYTPGTEPLHHEPFTTKVVLSDGGVYDNLGLETAWKNCKTVLVSDGGGILAPEKFPHSNWLLQGIRITNIIDNQVRSRRKIQLLESYTSKIRSGAYWSIRTRITDYGAPNKLPCPEDRTLKLANVKTRLKHLSVETQKKLINWGYAICDAAIRSYVNPTLNPPERFPYEDVEV